MTPSHRHTPAKTLQAVEGKDCSCGAHLGHTGPR